VLRVKRDRLCFIVEALDRQQRREDVILAANPLITDRDRIFVGQIIYLPVVPPAAAVPATGQGVVTPTRIGAV
jgi:hypothetical protein